GLADHMTLAVGAAATGRAARDSGSAAAAARAARRREDPGDIVRFAAGVLGPVGFPDAGAVEAEVAEAVAVDAGAKVAANGGVIEPVDGVEVSDAFSGTRDARRGVVGVHAVAPLVVEDGGDLTGVRATPAGAVEVDGT